MKIGIFYELPLPRSWKPDDDPAAWGIGHYDAGQRQRALGIKIRMAIDHLGLPNLHQLAESPGLTA
jgi:hypothetical protein